MISRNGRLCRSLAAVALAAIAACRSPEHTFHCSDDSTLRVRYAEQSAIVRLPEGSATLPIARSASGARYANDTLEFWEHAGEARVTRNGRVLHENCRPER